MSTRTIMAAPPMPYPMPYPHPPNDGMKKNDGMKPTPVAPVRGGRDAPAPAPTPPPITPPPTPPPPMDRAADGRNELPPMRPPLRPPPRPASAGDASKSAMTDASASAATTRRARRRFDANVSRASFAAARTATTSTRGGEDAVADTDARRRPGTSSPETTRTMRDLDGSSFTARARTETTTRVDVVASASPVDPLLLRVGIWDARWIRDESARARAADGATAPRVDAITTGIATGFALASGVARRESGAASRRRPARAHDLLILVLAGSSRWRIFHDTFTRVSHFEMRAVAVAVAGRPPTHVASPRALTRARGSIARPPRATEKDADADAPLSARVAAPDVKKKKDVDDDDDASIAASMAAARACEASGMSPGAGLSSAEDQAEAAFADMINTTVDVTGEALDADARARLAEGGRMDGASTSRKSGGMWSDVRDLFGALGKGAHIVRQKNGRV